jgi:hypothetical protein
MKLNYFSSQTLPKGEFRTTKPKVSFGKAGTINFNSNACKLMELEPGVKISLAQDENTPENWYFFIDEVNGFELREGYDKKSCLLNHANLIKVFSEAFDLDTDETNSFAITTTPTVLGETKYWGVLVDVEKVEAA